MRAVFRSLVVVALAVSIALGARESLRRAERNITSKSGLSALQARNVAGHTRGLTDNALEAFRRAVRPSDRFFVDVPKGSPGVFNSQGQGVRDYLDYDLLPAIDVGRADEATIVLHYRFDGAYSVTRIR